MLETDSRYYNLKEKIIFSFVLFTVMVIYFGLKMKTIEGLAYLTIKTRNIGEITYQVPKSKELAKLSCSNLKLRNIEKLTYQAPKSEESKDFSISSLKPKNIGELIYQVPKTKETVDFSYSILKSSDIEELAYQVSKTSENLNYSTLDQLIFSNSKIKNIKDFRIDIKQTVNILKKDLLKTQMDMNKYNRKVQDDFFLELQFASTGTKQEDQQLSERFARPQLIYNCVENDEKKPGEYFLESQIAMEYTEEDVNLLAKIIYAEAGICDKMEKYRVGNVVLNRVNDETNQFENSIEGVIYQDGQFTSVGGKNWNNGPTEEEIGIAIELLEGKRVFPENVVWFSKKCNYGQLYYTSEWHEFSAWELSEES